VAQVTIVGVLLTFVAGLASVALLVRPPRGERVPRVVAFLPLPLLLYNGRVTAFLALTYVRLYLLTNMPPPLAVQLTAAILLAISLLSVAWLWAYVTLAWACLGAGTSRTVVRVTQVSAAVVAALLVVGWGGFLLSGEAALFLFARGMLGDALFPGAFAATVWLFLGASRVADPGWGRALSALSARYLGVFAALSVLSLTWGRLSDVSPALTLGGEVALAAAYNVVTMAWMVRLPARLDAGGPPPPSA
jgi:hypothetical protein